MIDAIEDIGVETPVWTFLGPRPAYWWARRRLHEATVHRADGALALGLEYALSPELAADGIGEWLERVASEAGRDGAPIPLEDGHTVTLYATDPGVGVAGQWTIRAEAGRISWSHGVQDGSVMLRGGAVNLLLALVRRVRLEDTDIEVSGDASIWQTWLGRTPF